MNSQDSYYRSQGKYIDQVRDVHTKKVYTVVCTNFKLLEPFRQLICFTWLNLHCISKLLLCLGVNRLLQQYMQIGIFQQVDEYICSVLYINTFLHLLRRPVMYCRALRQTLQNVALYSCWVYKRSFQRPDTPKGFSIDLRKISIEHIPHPFLPAIVFKHVLSQGY